MDDLYVLVDGEPVLEPDPLKWSQWFATTDRKVAFTRFGHVSVSTVFLGIDHRSSVYGPPLLFETLIQGGKHNGQIYRYTNRADALEGHDLAVKLAWSVKDWSPRTKRL